MNIIKNTVVEIKKNWDRKIKSIIYMGHVTKARLPINLKIKVYHLLQQFTMNQKVVEARINQLVEIDETRRMSFDQMIRNHERIKETFD